MHLRWNLEARVLVYNSSTGGGLTLDEAFQIWMCIKFAYSLLPHRILTFHKYCALPVISSNGSSNRCYTSREFYDEKHGWKKICQVEENRAAAKGEALYYEDLYLYAA